MALSVGGAGVIAAEATELLARQDVSILTVDQLEASDRDGGAGIDKVLGTFPKTSALKTTTVRVPRLQCPRIPLGPSMRRRLGYWRRIGNWIMDRYREERRCMS